MPNVGGAPGVAGVDGGAGAGRRASSRQATAAVRKPSGARMRNWRRVFIAFTEMPIRRPGGSAADRTGGRAGDQGCGSAVSFGNSPAPKALAPGTESQCLPG